MAYHIESKSDVEWRFFIQSKADLCAALGRSGVPPLGLVGAMWRIAKIPAITHPEPETMQ